MPLSIFIDTSVFLSFYSVSNDDLEQLSKIIRLIEEREINILITSQVSRELWRNRDNKLVAAINELQSCQPKIPAIPRFMQEYAEIKEYRKLLEEADRARKSALSRARKEASDLLTSADAVIQQIFKAAGISELEDEIFNRAHKRMILGDPPGKSASIGDRVNWEHLLSSNSLRGGLHLVTRDNDFSSDLDKTRPHQVLLREWRERKAGELFVHSEIKQFLSTKFSNFNFSKKVDMVKALENARTPLDHRAIKSSLAWIERKETAIQMFSEAKDEDDLLSAIDSLNALAIFLDDEDIARLCEIALDSDIVKWNSLENSVQSFFINIIPRAWYLLDKNDMGSLNDLFEIEGDILKTEDKADPLTTDYEQIYLDDLDDRFKQTPTKS